MFVNSEKYAKYLQESLRNLHLNGDLCDITITVDNHQIKAHKAVLAAASPFFRAMLRTNSPFIEAAQNQIHLKEIDKDAVEQVIRFIYTSKIRITDDNVYDIMEVVERFQINGLKYYLSHYLYNSLSNETCLAIYVTAQKYSYAHVTKQAFGYILNRFRRVAQTEEFLETPVQTLYTILKSGHAHCDSEEEMFQFVMRWVKHSEETRKEYMVKLLDTIDWTKFSMTFLKNLRRDPLVYEFCKHKISKVIEQKLKLSSKKSKKGQRNGESQSNLFTLPEEPSDPTAPVEELSYPGLELQLLLDTFLEQNPEANATEPMPILTPEKLI